MIRKLVLVSLLMCALPVNAQALRAPITTGLLGDASAGSTAPLADPTVLSVPITSPAFVPATATTVPAKPKKLSFADKHPKIAKPLAVTTKPIRFVGSEIGKGLKNVGHRTSESLIWLGHRVEPYQPLLNAAGSAASLATPVVLPAAVHK